VLTRQAHLVHDVGLFHGFGVPASFLVGTQNLEVQWGALMGGEGEQMRLR
jgi:hypothetical protein